MKQFLFLNAVFFTLPEFSKANKFYIEDDKHITSRSNALTLNLHSGFSNSFTGANSAKITEYDPSKQCLYIANSIGAKLNEKGLVDPTPDPTKLVSDPVARCKKPGTFTQRTTTIGITCHGELTCR